MRYRLRYQQHNLELPPGVFLIGRSTECQLSLDDPLVSRKHAKLSVTDDGVTVEDLGSRNGVIVDGTKIEGPKRVGGGTRITIGSQEMVVLETATDRAPTMTNMQAAYTTFAGQNSPLPDLSAIAQAAPPPAPAGDDMTKKASALKLLAGVADKALAMGRAEEAERILQAVLTQILEAARSGQTPSDDACEQAGRYAGRLASATAKGSWVDYVIELYALQARPLPASVVDELYGAVRKVGAVNLGALRDYLAALREKSGSFGPAERFLLQRVEGLERLVALK